MVLYYRNALHVAQHLFSNPVFASCMEFDPYKLFDTQDGKHLRVYEEFLSANFAWDYQVGGENKSRI